MSSAEVNLQPISQQDAWKIFNDATMRTFGETASVWLAKWDKGEYSMDEGDHPKVSKIYMLFPLIGESTKPTVLLQAYKESVELDPYYVDPDLLYGLYKDPDPYDIKDPYDRAVIKSKNFKALHILCARLGPPLRLVAADMARKHDLGFIPKCNLCGRLVALGGENIERSKAGEKLMCNECFDPERAKVRQSRNENQYNQDVKERKKQ